jgi:hypothetical protein
MERKIQEKVEKGYIYARIVIELLGAPKEHIEETFRLVLKRLKEEKGVEVLSGDVHEAKPQGKLFSTFAELDVLLRDFPALTKVCFDYLPSSVEIVEPQSFRQTALEVSNFVNDMVTYLHEVDMRLKDANAANILLEQNSSNLLKNIVHLVLKKGSATTEQLGADIGIPSSQLEPFLTQYEKEGLIKKNASKWENA